MAYIAELRRDLHPIIDNTRVEIYHSADWPYHPQVGRLLPGPDHLRPSVSLISTVKNEGQAIKTWLVSLLGQTVRPNEIVIVDGGSTDTTYQILQEEAQFWHIPIRLIQAPGANIAHGRNLAIQNAVGEIIACTDAGCVVPANWLANITGPFVLDADVEVVGGYYQALQLSDFHRSQAAYFVHPVGALDFQQFLPSTRSIAFKKSAWEAVGGFPEWLSLTAEDTLFAIQLKSRAASWAFVPEAQVLWQLRDNIPSLFKQVRRYGHGDAEAGLFPNEYWNRIRLSVSLVISLLIILVSYISLLISRNALLLLPGLVSGLWLIRRLYQITLKPSWTPRGASYLKGYLLSAVTICTITAAMVIGYLEGVRARV